MLSKTEEVIKNNWNVIKKNYFEVYKIKIYQNFN